MELFAEIKKKEDYSKVGSKYKDKYRQEDISFPSVYDERVTYLSTDVGEVPNSVIHKEEKGTIPK